MLVDTNIFVDFLRGRKNALRFFEKETNLSTSVICVMEIISGFKTKREASKFLKFLDTSEIKVQHINHEVSKESLELFLNNHHRMGIGIPDTIILATASYYGKGVATLDTKHFAKTKEVRIRKPY